MKATKIQPGDDTHLTLLMAPHSLNFVTGADRAALLAYGRDVFAAARDSKCLAQIEEPAQPIAGYRISDPSDPTIKPWLSETPDDNGYKSEPLYAGAAPADVAGPALSLLERQAIEALCAVAVASFHAADDSSDNGNIIEVQRADFEALDAALDLLDELPDDQPGYTMTPGAKAKWALRRLLDAAPALEAPAATTPRTTGYIAPKGRYVPPVLFNPYTGEPRDARDIASDPQGVLIVPPGAAIQRVLEG